MITNKVFYIFSNFMPKFVNKIERKFRFKTTELQWHSSRHLAAVLRLSQQTLEEGSMSTQWNIYRFTLKTSQPRVLVWPTFAPGILVYRHSIEAYRDSIPGDDEGKKRSCDPPFSTPLPIGLYGGIKTQLKYDRFHWFQQVVCKQKGVS